MEKKKGWFPKFRRQKNQPHKKGRYSMYWDDESMQAVKDVAAGKTTKFRASLKIGVHVRTVERKVKEYHKKGDQCFVHGNKGKTPSNKVDLAMIMKYIQDHDLSGCNFTELCRLMNEYDHISISSSCIRKRYLAEGLLSVKCQRKTRKKMKKFLRELKKAEQITQEKLETLSALEQEEIWGYGTIPPSPNPSSSGNGLRWTPPPSSGWVDWANAPCMHASTTPRVSWWRCGWSRKRRCTDTTSFLSRSLPNMGYLFRYAPTSGPCSSTTNRKMRCLRRTR